MRLWKHWRGFCVPVGGSELFGLKKGPVGVASTAGYPQHLWDGVWTSEVCQPPVTIVILDD